MNVRPFALGFASPLATAHGEIREREGFLVGVEFGDRPASDATAATRGVGEATPLPGWTESRAACADALDAVAEADLVDADAGPSGDVTARLRRYLKADDTCLDPVLTPEAGELLSEAPAARHGVALALLDAAARDASASLATLLADRDANSTPAETVPVNATVGDGSPEETAAAARDAARAGYPAVKVKAGARPLERDLERVRAVRDAVGESVVVRVDANEAWDRPTARRALDRLADLDVAYVEQPLDRADLPGLAELRASSPTPVALDESLATAGVAEVLAVDAADALILKPMVLGGPDRALAAADRALAAGVEPVVTTTVDAVVARTAAVHVAAAIPDVVPCGLATGSLLADDLAADPAPVDAGRIRVPTAPGVVGDAVDDRVF